MLPLISPTRARSPSWRAKSARSIFDVDLLVNNAGVLVAGERFGGIEPKSLRDSFAANAEGRSC